MITQGRSMTVRGQPKAQRPIASEPQDGIDDGTRVLPWHHEAEMIIR
jgi:hypothetical protein